jgi:putative effector of murein hydrolase LrgA (UPF0299 family)
MLKVLFGNTVNLRNFLLSFIPTNVEVLSKLQNCSRQQQQKIFTSAVIEFVVVMYYATDVLILQAFCSSAA